jgi:hypothetical protein
VAWEGSYPRSFTYSVTQSGTFYLDAYSYSGAGGYTVTYSITSPPPGDAVGPVCGARNVAVTHDKICKLYFSILDEQSAEVTKHLVITTQSGVVKKSWSWDYAENFDGWWFIKYTCRLPRGSYRIVVTGEDLAGNTASVVGRATLKVK